MKSIFDLNVFFFNPKKLESCSIYILNSMDQIQPNSRADPQLNPGSGRGLLFENLRLLGVYYMDLLYGFTLQLFLVYSGSAFYALKCEADPPFILLPESPTHCIF